MKIDKEAIRRFTSGKHSYNDNLKVFSYFFEKEYDDALRELLNEEWEKTEMSEDDEYDLDSVLNKLHDKIGLLSTKTIRKDRILKIFSRCASILFIPLIMATILLSILNFKKESVVAWAEIHSPLGTRTSFQLPDGTLGWLNSGSTLKYPLDFSNHRIVKLSGEAWLDVAHIDFSNFKVETSEFDVKVAGTTLNVVAYENDNFFEVILEDGSVIVENKDIGFRGKLLPNQRLIYNKDTQELSQTNIDSKAYTSWKDGTLIFYNKPMSEIARQLGHRYNAEIILYGEELKSSIFRATFQDENIEEICKLLATVAPIKYVIHDRRAESDGSFPPHKIEMWLIE